MHREVCAIGPEMLVFHYESEAHYFYTSFPGIITVLQVLLVCMNKFRP